jgi:CBS domain-containing protein
MEVPERIRIASDRLKAGHRINRITVRDLLRHFDAERRGAVKTQRIRTILDSLELETDPDFESAWIDAPIFLRLRKGAVAAQAAKRASDPGGQVTSGGLEEIVLDSTPSSVEHAEEQSESAPMSTEPETANAEKSTNPSGDDPTYRIGNFPEANKKLIVVNQNDSLTKAITLMLQHDFSQLPVMQGEREVKGVVTWKSIGSKQALGCEPNLVGECREDARIVDSNRTLFDAISTIVEYGYVLVRDQRDRRITGIVTASDLSLQFQSLAEPFLLLREIELHVRQLLEHKVTAQDFDLLHLASPTSRKPVSVADLSFGEYVRLLQHPQIWAKVGLKIDAGLLTGLLENVRVIRNDVMHFDPDPMTHEELKTLKGTVRFMQELFPHFRLLRKNAAGS